MTLYLGDCLDVLPTLPAASVDAVVTDPPAGIEFMGKEWDSPGKWSEAHSGFGFRDGAGVGGVKQRIHTRNPNCKRCRKHTRGSKGCRCPEGPDMDEDLAFQHRAQVRTRERFIAFLTAILAECLRVAKPGARLLCWAIPRTSHWTGTAIEDAGWVIEDRLCHLFGQGFPKAKSKLKPACEDWWLARKPSKGVPALPGLDGCRIASEARPLIEADRGRMTGHTFSGGLDGSLCGSRAVGTTTAGRWPANVVLSHLPECRCVGRKRVKSGTAHGQNGSPSVVFNGRGALGTAPKGEELRGYADADGLETVEAWECAEGCVVKALDEQSGERPVSGSARLGKPNARPSTTVGFMRGAKESVIHQPSPSDTGGASRFYYCPKASKADRGPGNDHPTVKSTALMRWLCRLITPPGGTVLDPFAGSGSTLKAAQLEGFDFIGVESDPHYFAIAERRLAAVQTEAPLFAS